MAWRDYSRHLHPRAPSTKASARGPLIAFDWLGPPAWTPRDYAAFAREGFMRQRRSSIARCGMIAEAAASVPLLLYEGDEEIAEHPLLDLLGAPQSRQAGPELIESLLRPSARRRQRLPRGGRRRRRGRASCTCCAPTA